MENMYATRLMSYLGVARIYFSHKRLNYGHWGYALWITLENLKKPLYGLKVGVGFKILAQTTIVMATFQ